MGKCRILCIAVVLLMGVAAAGCGDKSGGSGNPGAATGHLGMDLVAGGVVMSSESYRLVLTTAQGPGGNGVMTSQTYRLRAGLVGSTQ